MLKILLWLLPLGGYAQISTSQWRPVFHFTPERNWTNDPNGLLFLDGVYHLYNQQNPFGNEWGHMSWGHARSTDLVHWHHLPLALPEKVAGDDTTWRFSGCAVYDAENTSGLCDGGKGCIVAVYTADQPHQHRESQYVAYSNDGGLTLTDYAKDPVIDLHLKDFRDPNVSWNAALRRWLMVVSMVDQHKVRFYSSPNLIAWTLLSEFGPAGYTGQPWECPAFFRLPVQGRPGVWKWVLTVSAWGPSGAPMVQYFIGDFDGKMFTSTRQDVLDYGNTLYASIPWNGLPAGKCTYIGWLVPEPRPTWPWRGAMSIPRDLSLRVTPGGIVLCQEPAALIKKAIPPGAVRALTAPQALPRTLERATANAYWIHATLHLGTAVRVGFHVALDSATGEQTTIGYDKVTGTVYVDRSHGDTTGLRAGKLFQSMPVTLKEGVLDLEILLDKSILEVFAGHGEKVLTTLIFPGKDAGGISAFADGGTARLDHYEIRDLNNLP